MFVVASVFVFQEILFATLWVAARERTDFESISSKALYMSKSSSKNLEKAYKHCESISSFWITCSNPNANRLSGC